MAKVLSENVSKNFGSVGAVKNFDLTVCTNFKAPSFWSVKGGEKEIWQEAQSVYMFHNDFSDMGGVI